MLYYYCYINIIISITIFYHQVLSKRFVGEGHPVEKGLVLVAAMGLWDAALFPAYALPGSCGTA